MFYSETVTVGAQKAPISGNHIHYKVTQMVIKIRSMGTATYVAFGGFLSQDYRLTAINSPVSISSERKHTGIKHPEIHPEQKWFDIMDLYVSSDTSDAVIEILAEVLPEGENT